MYDINLLFLQYILYIIYITQEYSFQITMRQQWNDKRLNFKDRLKGHLKGKAGRLQITVLTFYSSC